MCNPWKSSQALHRDGSQLHLNSIYLKLKSAIQLNFFIVLFIKLAKMLLLLYYTSGLLHIHFIRDVGSRYLLIKSHNSNLNFHGLKQTQSTQSLTCREHRTVILYQLTRLQVNFCWPTKMPILRFPPTSSFYCSPPLPPKAKGAPH